MSLLIQNRFALAGVIAFGIGFAALLLQKNLVRKVVGFNIMDAAVLLLLASLGYVEGAGTAAHDAINSVAGGVVLAGIVVSVSITAFALALIWRVYQRYGTVELDVLLERIGKERE